MKSSLALLLALLVVVGCGIPIDNEPEVVDIDLPDPPDQPTEAPGDLAAVTLYLVKGESLIRVTRDLPVPATLDMILDSLVSGITEPERVSSLRSAVPPDTRLIDLEMDGDIARINLSREFAAVGGDEEILAVAQIVLTATSVDGISRVALLLEGVPTDAPVADGALSIEPVGADDYATLVSP